ncbi:hypothetical protein AGLY_002058, partial [Aphis glycines]
MHYEICIRFEEHKLICETHKPILPRMPAPESMLEFNAWKKTQRHPIVIYADFVALLKKLEEKCGNNTKVIQKHEVMSYGFMIKANSDVPTELLEQFNIPTSPIIFRGDEDNKNVGKNGTCNLCKNGFFAGNQKVADRCHLSVIFRQTLCNTCNFKLQSPNFAPCFFHNLSNYDAHFIVTELEVS